MDECKGLLGNETVFSTLGLNRAYGTTEVADENIDKSAITSQHSLFDSSQNVA